MGGVLYEKFVVILFERKTYFNIACFRRLLMT
jgi:hypothetical protein